MRLLLLRKSLPVPNREHPIRVPRPVTQATLLCGLLCCLSAAVQPLAQRLSAKRKSITDNGIAFPCSSFRARQKRRSNTALFCYPEATNSGFTLTDGKDTAAKTKPLISKENAQNRPETIQRGQVLGVSAFREQIGNSARIALHLTPTHFRIVPIMYHVKNAIFVCPIDKSED